VRRLAGLLLAAAATTTTTPPGAQADAERVVRLTQAGIVRIETHAHATVSAAMIDVDDAAVQDFVHRDVDRLLSSGQRFFSAFQAEQAIEADLTREVTTNPNPYLKAGKRISDDYDTVLIGSGFVVSPSGWVVTASAAVGDDSALRKAAADSERNVIRADFADITSGDLGLPAPITDQQRQTLVDAALAKVEQTVEVSGTTFRVTVQGGEATPGRSSGEAVFDDVHVMLSRPDDAGTGLAVLQLPPGSLASVPLQDHVVEDQGAPVVAVGYPGDRPAPGADPPTAPVRPVGSAGTLGAHESGATPITAGFTTGVGGGPVVDADGRVVGVAVKKDNSSAMVDVAAVQRLLQDAKARPAVDDASRAYRDAADAMSRHYYRRALPLFRKVSGLAPAMPFVGEQAQEALQQIALGNDLTPSTRPAWVLALAAALFALTAIAVSVVANRRFAPHRRRD